MTDFHKLITFTQLENYLIAFFPLYDTQEENTPFGVSYFDAPMRIHHIGIAATPWEAYRELAQKLYRNPFTHVEISKYWQYH